MDYQQALGDRLRSIRNQQGLTLQDVEQRSNGTWKAVVIGSYERGDRAISVSKLAALAAFYGVPVSELLPAGEGKGEREPAELATSGRIVLDLTSLDADVEGLLGTIARYARRIQIERGDYNGRVLTLRGDDVKAVSAATGTTVDEVIEALVDRDALLG
ncbi:MAG: transcriptional regulator [Actinomycetes bacterium]